MGVNTSPFSQLPALDTSDIRLSVESPTSAPTTPQAQRLPSVYVTTTLSSTSSPSREGIYRKPKINNNRARNESRKLLAHVLGQLERRPLPPPIFDVFIGGEDELTGTSFGVLVGAVKGAVKLKTEDESDDEGGGSFSTDETYELMLQLKDVLTMSIAQGWQIFYDGSSPVPPMEAGNEPTGKLSSSFSRSRNSLQPGGKRSRSPSPAYGRQVQAPALLSSCISILASIILEDCRYKMSSPRPSRPPNALQALCLDIAQFLIQTHRHDPKVISKIGFALIPAFSAFPPEMYVRLLTFFESVIRGVLDDLHQIEGIQDVLTSDSEEIKQQGHWSGESAVVSIQVDEACEYPSSGSRQSKWLTWSSSAHSKLHSSNAPLQRPSVYYLASLVPPLLAELSEHVDLAQPDPHPEALHRLRRLLHLIVEKKLDFYTDVLQVMGYHTPKARGFAAGLLLYFWPRAVGHPTVSAPFPEHSSSGALFHVDGTRDFQHNHQFMPWHFARVSNHPSFRGLSSYDCRACSNPIRGFGLFCSFCMGGVHFDCYDDPAGSHLVQYAMASDQNVQRVAMYRFSSILSSQRHTALRPIRRNEHVFRPVNIFTLCLCFICRKPLFGSTMQALNCISCMCFVHPSCLSNISSSSSLPTCPYTHLNSDHLNIDWRLLRKSCVDFYSDILHLTKEELEKHSYEDLSIIYAFMRVQLQILTNGVALGSIVVSQNGRNAAHAKDHKVDQFELHQILMWCETILSSDRLQCSDSLDDYVQENHLSLSDHNLVFDWSNLIYISTVIKTQFTNKSISHSASSDLLNVHRPDPLANQLPAVSSQPFEVVSLGYLRDALGSEFNIYSDFTARLILSHLNQLGIFDRLDQVPVLFNGSMKDAPCIFPLPLGLDLSVNVETLVSAIEASLSDLDLSVNEVGFLLLVRRFWPNGLISDYALRRLTRMLLSWVLKEDDCLAVILQDYLAKQKNLPGVRTARESIPWPSAQSSRPTPTSSVNNGGDYVAARRALLTRYSVPWLLALHDRDSSMYARLIYDICFEIEDDVAHGHVFGVQGGLRKEQLIIQHDKALHFITKLSQSSITFTIFEDLFLFWLKSISSLGIYDEPIPSLLRIFPRDAEMSNRFSAGYEFTENREEGSISAAIDPWHLLGRMSSESNEGLSLSLQWLCLFACSGVEVPVAVFLRFSALLANQENSLVDSLLLVKGILFSTWLKSLGRQELQQVFSELHARLSPFIKNHLMDSDAEGIAFIRLSLGTCLLLYGCDRVKILGLDLIQEADIKHLPSRKKVASHGSMIVDPIIVDPRLMGALGSYMSIDNNEIACLVAKFLNLFLNDSPYLEAYEVDNFILRNGRLLAICAWKFYDVQRHEITSIRTSFLLRTLVVDSQPFQDILHTCFSPESHWEQRVLYVTRLFRIMLDITSPSFNMEDRQWRSSVTVIFYYFFNAMWADEREEVRVAADSFSSTLLPAHFQTISLCWSEFLAKAPIAERAKLITFLTQLFPHFPSWKVLTWDAIVEALLEDEYDGKEKDDLPPTHLYLYGPSPADNDRFSSINLDQDMVTLRVSIILLSLQMIASGVPADTFTLLKLKIHLVRVFGFSDVSAVPSQHGHSFHVQFGVVSEIPILAYPCIHALLPVLDAYCPVELNPSVMAGANELDDRPSSVLVGSIFVDVFLTMFCGVRDLSSIPVLTVKSMLESLCVVIYKHDFECDVLRHLQQTLRRAVLRSTEILSEDVSYELRQLALSVTQAFVKRWYSFMGSIIYTSFESVTKLIASQHHHGQDALITQAKSFLNSTLTTYANTELFIGLLRRRLDQEFFVVLKQITDVNAKHNLTSLPGVRETLLRDVLSRVVDNDAHTFQLVLNNIETFVNVVFYHGYSPDLLLFVAQQITYISRRMSDLTVDTVDPSPLLTICATLIHHNKTYCRDMLPHVDNILRIILNRLTVSAKCLLSLLQATASLYRRPQPGESLHPTNGILVLVLEILAEGLRMKARIPPSTLKSMLEAVTTTTHDTKGSMLALLEPGLHFLQQHIWSDVSSESDFSASLAVAKMVLQLARNDGSVATKLSEYGIERTHTNLGVRSWNILALAALLESKVDWPSMLFENLSSFSIAYHGLLRVFIQSGSPLELSTADINHAYIGIKLWIMLAHKTSNDQNLFAVWNELWPQFESLIDVFDIEARTGQHQTLLTLVTSSIADLFIFLRTLHSPIALNTSYHIATLNRLRGLGRGETSTPKLTRALKYMSELPPEMSFDVLVNQTAKDIVAAEKLRVLEAKVAQERRVVPDRHWARTT